MKFKDISRLSADKFFNKIPKNPVIVTNLFTHPWLSASRGLQDDIDLLIRDEYTANLIVPIEIQQPGVALSTDQRFEVPFGLFYKLFIQNEQKDKKGYLAQYDLLSNSPYLSNLLPLIPHLRDLYAKSSSWLGPEGTLTPLHRDAISDSNILLQLVGQKRVNIVDPVYSNLLDLHPSNSPLRNFSKQSAEYPKEGDFIVHTAILEPEESVYIPAGYYHSFKSLSRSFSVNFWFNLPK
ncbi:hypothetical protein E3Q18_01418 [Wallemia mellicola]|nr:hypothetical protein E3Q18_01418 [Wallemia mellicola]